MVMVNSQLSTKGALLTTDSTPATLVSEHLFILPNRHTIQPLPGMVTYLVRVGFPPCRLVCTVTLTASSDFAVV
jgi:hypothetical protein